MRFRSAAVGLAAAFTTLVFLLATSVVAWAVSPAGQVIDRTLAARGSDVVLLGNSKVSTDLDLDAISRSLAEVPGAPPGGWRVGNANVFGTAAPVWDMVLQNRVYANGLHPRLLVIFGTLDALLGADLPNEVARATLAAQMDVPDPHIVSSIFRGVWDESVQERLRRMLLPACSPDRLREKDEGPGRPPYPLVAAPPVAPSESFLPDLVRLALAHDARVLVVRAPFGPSARWKEAGALPRLAETARLVHSLGADWVDLAADLPQESLFGDGVHMGEAGRAWATPRMAGFVRDALKGGPVVFDVRSVREVAPVVREGVWGPTEPPAAGAPPCEPPAGLSNASLVASGFGAVSPVVAGAGGRCQLAPALPVVDAAGRRAWWAAPGAPLRVDLPAGAGPMVVEVYGWLVPVGGAGPEASAWTSPGAEVVFEGPEGAGPRWVSARLTASGAAPTLRVGAAAGGPWLLLDRVDVLAAGLDLDRVGGPPPRRTIFEAGDRLGEAPDPAASPTLEVDLLALPPRYAAPPPPLVGPSPSSVLSVAPGMLVDSGGASAETIARYYVGGWHVPSEEQGFTAGGRGGCSPLRFRTAPDLPAVRTIVSTAAVMVSRADCQPVAPSLVGARWELSAERDCRDPVSSRWIYPGDELTWRVPVLPPLATAPSWLELGGGVVSAGVNEGDQVLRVVVVAIDARGRRKELAVADIAAGALRLGPVYVELPASRRPTTDMEVNVSLGSAPPESASWILVTSARLGAGPLRGASP